MDLLAALAEPIVQAPMAGGPSTPELAAAVSEAGGLGFLAAGYKTPDAVAADIAAVRALTARPFGLNVFSPTGEPGDAAAVQRYAERLRATGAAVGEPRFDDDAYAAKLDLAVAERLPLVSFTFGCPDPGVVERLHQAGAAVWVTITTPGEARQAHAAGADALVVQGTEAGGHRASFADRPGSEQIGLLALLRLVAAAVPLPMVATGGIPDGAAVAAVLCAGAAAAQLGSAFMLTPEAATSQPHREALAQAGATRLTRAFSGRLARGIVNGFMHEHPDAPVAYPEIHHATSKLRADARKRGDADGFNLWAGQAHALAVEQPAAAVVRTLAHPPQR